MCCRVGPMFAMILIGLGTGGIKPCVSAFGGDQFMAEQVGFFAYFEFCCLVFTCADIHCLAGLTLCVFHHMQCVCVCVCVHRNLLIFRYNILTDMQKS